MENFLKKLNKFRAEHDPSLVPGLKRPEQEDTDSPEAHRLLELELTDAVKEMEKDAEALAPLAMEYFKQEADDGSSTSAAWALQTLAAVKEAAPKAELPPDINEQVKDLIPRALVCFAVDKQWADHGDDAAAAEAFWNLAAIKKAAPKAELPPDINEQIRDLVPGALADFADDKQRADNGNDTAAARALRTLAAVNKAAPKAELPPDINGQIKDLIPGALADFKREADNRDDVSAASALRTLAAAKTIRDRVRGQADRAEVEATQKKGGGRPKKPRPRARNF